MPDESALAAERLVELVSLATPGPWEWATDKGPPQYVQLYSTNEAVDEYEADVLSADNGADLLIGSPDAELITYLRNHVPEIVALLARVEAMEEAAKEQCDGLLTLHRLAEANTAVSSRTVLAVTGALLRDHLIATLTAAAEPPHPDTQGGTMSEETRPAWSWDRECADPDCAVVGEHWHNGYRYWGLPTEADSHV